MAKLIRTTGEVSEVAPNNGSNFELKEMYDLLNCSMIEIIRTPDNRLMVIDEEGKLKESERNDKATKVMAGALFAADWIAGDALICNHNEIKD